MCTFAKHRARYGSVRITDELNEAGYACCVNYIADIMKGAQRYRVQIHEGCGSDDECS
ncbi:IS3 family transposase [Vibrio vulnificus]|uniref:IS3 family transposase n=1 Tax=Vibrio vulnificus TaxID=672 RepID=UPI0038B2F73B